jgi:hypothetical protein
MRPIIVRDDNRDTWSVRHPRPQLTERLNASLDHLGKFGTLEHGSERGEDQEQELYCINIGQADKDSDFGKRACKMRSDTFHDIHTTGHEG